MIFSRSTTNSKKTAVFFASSEGQLGAHICFEETLKLRKKEQEGARSRPERPEAPKEPQSHDLLSLSAFQSLETEDSCVRYFGWAELLGSQLGARRGSE